MIPQEWSLHVHFVIRIACGQAVIEAFVFAWFQVLEAAVEDLADLRQRIFDVTTTVQGGLLNSAACNVWHRLLRSIRWRGELLRPGSGCSARPSRCAWACTVGCTGGGPRCPGQIGRAHV